jgi:hypothetical protein
MKGAGYEKSNYRHCVHGVAWRGVRLSRGAELFGDKTTIVMVCPCCGNAQIVEKRLSEMLKPDYIIPFKRDKNAAEEALEEFCKGKRLLPASFSPENRVTGLKGVYAPFWLFDATARGRVVYDAAKEESHGKSTVTVHYTEERDGSLAFEKIPADGSAKMDDGYMDAIEPFDYKRMEEFRPSCLAGYTVEKCDVSAEKSRERTESRIKETVEDMFKESVQGYDKVTAESSDLKIESGKASCALFPVWVLNTKYNGEDYLFMMNGQTGKLVGNLPVDGNKERAYKALFTGLYFAVIAPLLYFIFYVIFKAEVTAKIVGGPDDIMKYVASLDISIVLSIIILSSIIISAWYGFRIVDRWKKEMSVRSDTAAYNYVVPGSLKYSQIYTRW